MAARKSRLSPERQTNDHQTVVVPTNNVGSTGSDSMRTDSPGSAPAELRASRKAPRFAAAFAIFLVWAAGLATLAVVVANPVTLNRVQIRAADVVVEGTIDATDMGMYLVRRSWPADTTEAVIPIENLDELLLHPDQPSLIPLKQAMAADGAYEIVPTPKPVSARLVYPATAETIEALEAILNSDE